MFSKENLVAHFPDALNYLHKQTPTLSTRECMSSALNCGSNPGPEVAFPIISCKCLSSLSASSWLLPPSHRHLCNLPYTSVFLHYAFLSANSLFFLYCGRKCERRDDKDSQWKDNCIMRKGWVGRGGKKPHCSRYRTWPLKQRERELPRSFLGSGCNRRNWLKCDGLGDWGTGRLSCDLHATDKAVCGGEFR